MLNRQCLYKDDHLAHLPDFFLFLSPSHPTITQPRHRLNHFPHGLGSLLLPSITKLHSSLHSMISPLDYYLLDFPFAPSRHSITMSRSDGSTSDQFWVPQWYLAYPPRSYDEHNSTPDDAEHPSGNYVRYASLPYFALTEDAFQYLPRYSNVASNYYMMESSYATGEPVLMENRPFLDLVPPPNTPVRSSFDDEDYSPVPCNFDFGGTENSHLFDYTEDEDMEDMEDMEDEDDEDTPDPIRPLFETAEIATLFDDTDIDDELELEWEICSCSNPQASMGDLPSDYDEPHPESP